MGCQNQLKRVGTILPSTVTNCEKEFQSIDDTAIKILLSDPPPIYESRNSYGNAIHNGLIKEGVGYLIAGDLVFFAMSFYQIG